MSRGDSTPLCLKAWSRSIRIRSESKSCILPGRSERSRTDKCGQCTVAEMPSGSDTGYMDFKSRVFSWESPKRLAGNWENLQYCKHRWLICVSLLNHSGKVYTDICAKSRSSSCVYKHSFAFRQNQLPEDISMLSEKQGCQAGATAQVNNVVCSSM